GRARREGQPDDVGLSRAQETLAGYAPRHLGRSRPLRQAVLVEVRQYLLHRRRRQARRGRLFLAARPRRRRHERRGPPRLDEGRALGDTTTLADPNVVATLKEKYEAEES